MQDQTQEPARLTLEIRESAGRSRRGRGTGTSISLRLAAVATADRQLMLVSAVADQSSISALRATLQSDPDAKTTFGVEAPGLRRFNLQQTDDRYSCHRVRLIDDSAQYHLVAVARTPGFIADDSPESLWRELTSERYTTPLLRAWLPWIKQQMQARQHFAEVARFNCKAALVRMTDSELDAIVQAGLDAGALTIPRDEHAPQTTGAKGARPTGLDEYMRTYGPALGEHAARRMKPLHIPSTTPPTIPALLRTPYAAQAHCATAIAAQLRRDNAALLVAECGTGKTLMGQAAIEAHARGRAYRALVFCPGQLVNKWEREINETIEGATVTQIESWSTLCKMDPRAPRTGKEWYIIGRDRAKLGSKWRAAYGMRKHKPANAQACGERFIMLPTCPACGRYVIDKEGTPLTEKDLSAHKRLCEFVRLPRSEKFAIAAGCGAPLWTCTGEIWRTEPAQYIKRRMRGFFEYLVVDECFPGETTVATPRGLRRIDSLRPGELVTSYNHTTGERVARRILRTIRKRLTGKLVTVKHESGLFRCTPNHKIWVIGHGYKPAGDLRPGERLIIDEQRNANHQQTLPGMRQAVQDLATIPPRATDMQPSLRPCHAQGARQADQHQNQDVPQSELRALRRSVHDSEETEAYAMVRLFVRGAGEMEIRSLPREDSAVYGASVGVAARARQTACAGNEQQSNYSSEIGRDNARSHVRQSRRERPAYNTATEIAHADRRLAHGVPDTDRKSEMESRRSGPSQSRLENCNRDRRRIAQNDEAEEQGRNQNDHATKPWMDSFAFLECRDGQQAGAGISGHRAPHSVQVTSIEHADAAPQWVYDLEVEDTHNYFAAGILVSNCHEEKGANSAQANAIGALCSSVKKTLALTGTLVGGQAEHIRPILFRLSPTTMVADNQTWEGALDFSRQYGRIDRITTVKSGGTGRAADNRQSRGSSSTSTREAIRPGIMPALFGRHLLDKTVFLSLNEVSEGLPKLNEFTSAVALDSQQRDAYKLIEQALTDAIRPMIQRGDRRLLGTMLNALLCFPDYPSAWQTLGYGDESGFVPVVQPPDLGLHVTRPKEQALIDLCRAEVDARRQVWVFAQYTDKHPVTARLEQLLTAAGLRATQLKATVSPAKREDWISKHGPKHDVIISHPKLVETGLDLFDKGGKHNFSTLCFYETGYNLFTLRQASRRSWRIGQKAECRVHYLYYGETMQARAMKLMGEKLAAAQALEGQFSAEGLIALSGEGESVEMALAKSLCANMDSAADRRIWEKIA